MSLADGERHDRTFFFAAFAAFAFFRATRPSETESSGETGDARRQDAAVDAGRVQVRRPRRIKERIRRIRIQHVEHVDADAKLASLDANVLAHAHIEHVERRTDLRSVRLDTDRSRAEL